MKMFTLKKRLAQILFLILTLMLAYQAMAQEQPQIPTYNPEDLVLPESERDSTAQAIFNNLKGLKKTASRPDSIKLQDEQAQAELQPPFIALATKAYADSIVLRWAPSTRNLFLYGQEVGYVVRKRLLPGGPPKTTPDTIELRNPNDPEEVERALRAAEEKRLAWRDLAGLQNPVKPYDSAQWAPYFPNDDKYALIAAGSHSRASGDRG